MKTKIYFVIFTLAICFLFGGVTGSGIYLNTFLFRTNPDSEQISWKMKSLKEYISSKIKPGNSTSETSPIKTNGGTLPQITENPHLEILDEKYSNCGDIDIREITISQIRLLFDANKLTSLELTKCYLERIDKMNPVLRAVNDVNPDALLEAAKADAERKLAVGNIKLGPLHGIPILIKENIATRADGGMETTAGSLAMVGIRPKEDAPVVKALRKAGAVIIGKANLSEFAFFRGTNIPSGWSGRGGQCRNAYNMNVTPEGSSSGSAVAVAANLAVVSVGTETDGSLIAPASIASICTIKPTIGTPSVKGIIPISHTQDNVGPMARSVRDLAILLDAMIPENERHPSHPSSFIDNLGATKTPGSFRIGIMRYPFFNTTAINSTNLEGELTQLEALISVLKNSVQFEVVDDASPEKELLQKISADKELLVLEHDFKHDFNEYLKTEVLSPYPLPNRSTPPPAPAPSSRKITCLKDVIKFNEKHPAEEGYNQELLVLSEATDGITNKTYLEAREANRNAAKGVLDWVIEKYNLDAVVTPSESRYDGILDEDLKDSSVVGYSIAAIAGYPSITVPAGVGLQDVPFGITFTGLPYNEMKLLQIAYAVEQITMKRVLPKFLI